MAYERGHQLFNPGEMVAGGGYSFADGLVATAGGTRAAALKLTAAINRIATCATAADSVALPPAVGGQTIYVFNSGAAAMQVFADPSTSDTINTAAAATGVSLAAAGKAAYVSVARGAWMQVLSA
jgi:hypothetical protein